MGYSRKTGSALKTPQAQGASSDAGTAAGYEISVAMQTFRDISSKMTPCTSTCGRVYVEVIGMATQSKFDLPQGTLDLLILRVVSLGPVHGYAIAQRIQMISKETLQIQQGSLYPALHRLENKNFLVAEWGPTETGREAKFYRLTAKGRTQLKTETESWERLAEVVAMILQHPLGEPS